MNAFQVTGRITRCDKKRDSVLVTLCFDNTSETLNNTSGTPTTPAFVGLMRIRLRKSILGRVNTALIAKGQIIEVQGFIQGVLHFDEKGGTTLDHELIAVRVVPVMLDQNKPDMEPSPYSPQGTTKP